MSQQQQQQLAQSNGVDIDYLAINRARWDERAPHVSRGLYLPTYLPTYLALFYCPRQFGVDMYDQLSLSRPSLN